VKLTIAGGRSIVGALVLLSLTMLLADECRAQPSGSTPMSSGPESPVTAQEAAAVMSKIIPCWNYPANMKPITIRVVVQLTEEGTPTDARLFDDPDLARYKSDRDFRIIADGVLRAVMNPRCQPWPLPAAKYATWRKTLIVFDPSTLGNAQ
jgi:hypothetical protein